MFKEVIYWVRPTSERKRLGKKMNQFSKIVKIEKNNNNILKFRFRERKNNKKLKIEEKPPNLSVNSLVLKF